MKINSGFITQSVPTAIWIATLISTYENLEIGKTGAYWITQKQIQEIAMQICNKNIDNARISQWCNADHPNNTYNYLRSSGKLRRLTRKNEFNGDREIPKELPVNATISSEIDLKLSDMLLWYKQIYLNLDFSKDDINTDDYYLKEKTNIVINKSNQNSLTSLDTIKNNNDTYFERIYNAIMYSWKLFCNKVGNQSVFINKEASMQLHFAGIIQQLLPLVSYSTDESSFVELETAVDDGDRIREADIMITAKKGDEIFRIVIELKCYKTYAASGGKRGAHDIFMKEVYQDLELVEKYLLNNQANIGLCFAMTDYQAFIYPNQKSGKCWSYDISQGSSVSNVNIQTPIGGHDINIALKKSYYFDWKAIGEYYFVKLEGK